MKDLNTLKEEQEARIQRDLDDAKFGMICSNEDTFKRYTFKQLDKVRKETAEAVCKKMMENEAEIGTHRTDAMIGYNKRIEIEKEIKKQIIKEL